MGLSNYVSMDQVEAAELSELVRGQLRPGALAIAMYKDIIEVSGTEEDSDGVNCELRGDFTELNFTEFKQWFPGWEVTDERKDSSSDG